MMNSAAGRLASVSASAEASQRATPPEQAPDIAIASVVAQAVGAMPMVLDLHAGWGAVVATYGSKPGQQVSGVAVLHPTPGACLLEVHVVLSEDQCVLASASPGADGHATLTDIAEQIRAAVYLAVRDMRQVVLTGVDVLIDDLR